ncbi:MAG: putative flagellin 1 [Archaeoglobus fulgidus]|uniref:Flagellin n=3 Tax=Archaeoglobus fulgidus TaxID=2234 RepID=A0A075WE10_ARCFL|nr:archaellin/type IV pilin N-terminal domain-containing protein [Archaeoglobus fulgidus]AIG97932.1 archaeal flagellin N-terminal-like domain protein [Archaeoglobus fulgidus DSM 8774]KUJ94035.1 MAG: putative flagellin 1 [Archaeoglobus fulgidus]KUK06600.1 MAG: putative flagellin 1 [Archaeoglobus fulgidus]
MRFLKNEKGFTGLEAAIVLIAFVTVAAVFSYVLLGAGFFATQKGQETVHTGVKQATSSMELVGSIVAKGSTTNNNITEVTFTLQLAAGGQPIDLNKTVITVLVPKDGDFVELSYNSSSSLDKTKEYYVNWVYSLQGSNPDNYLEEFEKAEVTLYLDSTGAGLDINPNDDFIIEVKPPIGASYPIELKAPPSIDDVMVLLK